MNLDPDDIQHVAETISRREFGRTPAEAHDAGICLRCATTVFWGPRGLPGAIYSDAGAREYKLSALCETCFDEMFEEPEEDEGE